MSNPLPLFPPPVKREKVYENPYYHLLKGRSEFPVCTSYKPFMFCLKIIYIKFSYLLKLLILLLFTLILYISILRR